jgi:hypothetical protein
MQLPLGGWGLELMRGPGDLVTGDSWVTSTGLRMSLRPEVKMRLLSKKGIASSTPSNFSVVGLPFKIFWGRAVAWQGRERGGSALDCSVRARGALRAEVAVKGTLRGLGTTQELP